MAWTTCLIVLPHQVLRPAEPLKVSHAVGTAGNAEPFRSDVKIAQPVFVISLEVGCLLGYHRLGFRSTRR